MVHSDRTVVVFLHKHFSSWHSTFFNSISIITNSVTLISASLTLCHTSTIPSPSSNPLITANFSLILPYAYFSLGLHAVGEVDLYFLLMSVRKTNTVDEETTQATWLYQQCNQSKHTTDGVTVMSLTAPATADKYGHRSSVLIVLNWKLSHKYEKLCKFSSRVKGK
jgi:hypothetical protein